jgi:hypothetical protein
MMQAYSLLFLMISHLPLLASHLTPASLLASAASSLSGPEIASIIVFVMFFMLGMFALLLLVIVATWKVYQKAGRQGWASVVPFYNSVVMLDIIGEPYWWVVLLLVPFVNIVILIIIARRLAACFGRGAGFTLGLIFLPFIFYPILAFGSAQYSAAYPSAPLMGERVKWALIAGLFFLLVEMFSMIIGLTGDVRPAQLTIIGGTSSGYATDGNYVYYNDSAIDKADAKTFDVKGSYGIDDHAVYYNGVKIPDADVHSFKLVAGSDQFAKDSTHVFDGSYIVQDADPNSFQTIGYSSYGYSKDTTHVFYNDQIIPGADAATFVVIPDNGTGATTPTFDAKDAMHTYSYGQVVVAPAKKK